MQEPPDGSLLFVAGVPLEHDDVLFVYHRDDREGHGDPVDHPRHWWCYSTQRWVDWLDVQAIVEIADGDACSVWPPTAPSLLGGHTYLSTACFHLQHGQCGKQQHDRQEAGEPHCKWCPAPCICQCHRGFLVTKEMPESERRDLANAHRDKVIPGSGVLIQPKELGAPQDWREVPR